MICHITGLASLPTGAVFANANFTFRRSPSVVAAQDAGVVTPQPVLISSNVSGLVDFSLLSGSYIGTENSTGDQFSFNVPIASTAAFSDCVAAATIPNSLGFATATTMGLVPATGASVGSVTAFLRADGTWVAPAGGSGGSSVWGGITGTLSAQTDLAAALASKQPLASVLTATTASYTTVEQSKLAGIAAGATANSPDITLLARANHTGTQAVGTITGLGSLATQSGTFSGSSSGTNTGDQTITLTGDVAGTGTGGFAATIAAGAVTLAKQANLAANSIIGNNTGLAAAPLPLTGAQVKALLAITSGDVSGLGSLATASSVSLTTQATGTLQAAQEPAHTGDVTNTAGSLAMTLATVNLNVGSFGSASAVATFTADGKGRMTAAGSTAISIASAAISDATTAGRAMLTAATATAQTALLDVVTSIAKGVVPASGGGTTNFLRADGTWTSPGGSFVDLTTAQTVAGVKTLSSPLGMAAQASDPAAPASGLLLYGKNISGMFAAKIAGMANHASVLQNAIWDRRVTLWMPTNTGGNFLSGGGSLYGNSHYNVGQALTNRYAYSPRGAWNNVVTTANQVLGVSAINGAARGSAANIGGFFLAVRAGFETWTNGGRMWVGLGAGVSNEPGFENSGCGFGIESTDAGLISFFTRNGYNTNTKVSTGLTAVSGSGYDFFIFCEPNTAKIEWMIRDVNAGTEVSGTATTNLWPATTFASFSAYGGNAALTAAAAIDFSCAGLYAETL